MADTETQAPTGTRGRKSQEWKHELFVEWWDTNFGKHLGRTMAEMTPAEIVAIHAARANDFRMSDTYAEATIDQDQAALKAQEEKLAALKARFEAKANRGKVATAAATSGAKKPGKKSEHPFAS